MSSLVQPTFNLQVSKAQHDIGGSSVQQDNGLRAEINGSDGSKAVVVAVFDGHGTDRGQFFSEMCKDQLQEIITKENFKDRFDANPEAVGHETFFKMHNACFHYNKDRLNLLGKEFQEKDGLIHTDNIKEISGGTTATVIIATDKGQVHCFNAGDSDAWLINGYKSTILTGDHSPECPAEYERIQASWPETKHIFDYNWRCGIAERKDGNHVFPKRNGFIGYYRKNLSGDMATLIRVTYNGQHSHLAMTRSIGDEPHRHGGVTWEPSYVSCQAGPNSVIKIASDGYWDSIVNSDIGRTTQHKVSKHGYDADALCQKWFRETEKTAKQHFGSTRDNMWGYIVTITNKD
jgi:serine/threonine protein phosphatase PrpC